MNTDLIFDMLDLIFDMSAFRLVPWRLGGEFRFVSSWFLFRFLAIEREA
jgi:hypothetical protein